MADNPYEMALTKLIRHMAGSNPNGEQLCPPKPHECPVGKNGVVGACCKKCWEEWALKPG